MRRPYPWLMQGRPGHKLMKCPSCNYVSHDYLDACPSCGGDVSAFKARMGLYARPPGVGLDVSAAAGRAAPAAPEIAAPPVAAAEAVPTLEFLEIEDEPSDGRGS